MSDADLKGPQPVSVEDWDDEAQTSIPGTRTVASANVAVKRGLNSDSNPLANTLSSQIHHKHGTDSGYVSKAPSMASSGRRRTSELKLDTAVQLERERKPYAMTANPASTNSSSRGGKEESKKEAPKPIKKPPFCHKEGVCWVCDRYGFHFDPKDPPKDLKKPAAKAIPVTKPAVISVKPVAVRPQAEEQARPPSRRFSSNQPRPSSMYVNMPVQQPVYPQYPVVHPGWPVTAAPPGPIYSQHPYVTTPATPIQYAVPQTASYYSIEPQQFSEDLSHLQQKPSRRMSLLSQERPVLQKRPSRNNTLLERTTSREQRPQLLSHKSSRSIDADKIAMPPPPKPQTNTAATGTRPRTQRSQTEYITRAPRYEEETESESEEEEVDHRTMMALKQQPPSPRRPPSSYKPPTQEHERPVMTAKSKSYDNGAGILHVAKTQRSDALPRRRTTESVPISTSDQKEAAAEAYMRKRGSLPVNDLTAENLSNLRNIASRQVSDQRSESGSTHSHLTHQSSSKDSSIGRGRVQMGHSRGTSMSINVNGVNLAITDGGPANGDATPIRLDVAGVQISMNNRDKENIDYYKRPQKQLERAPSMSRTSRRSLTQSLVSAATSGSRRENEVLQIEPEARELSRRGSRVDEDERELLRTLSQRSSRQTSRNASTVRQAEDMPSRPKVQSHRSSVDYSHYEPVM